MRRLLSIVLLLAAVSVARADEPTGDALVRELRARGHTVSPECLYRSTAFPGLVAVGFLGEDPPGCIGSGVASGTEILARLTSSRVALERAGWAQADAARRVELVWLYLRELPYHFRVIAESAPPGFGGPFGPPFEAPTADVADDGSIVVRFWGRAAPRSTQPSFQHVRIRFDATGTASEPETLVLYTPLEGASR
jgi:hypothetical protein